MVEAMPSVWALWKGSTGHSEVETGLAPRPDSPAAAAAHFVLIGEDAATRRTTYEMEVE